MKKYLLSVMIFSLSLVAFAQESSIFRVSVQGIDMQQAGAFYYAQFIKNLDGLILANKVHVFKDEALKERIELETYKKETFLPRMWQIINPMNPDDPYDLIDTVIHANQAMVTAEFLTWKGQSIEVKTKNTAGPVTYYLAVKEVEKADKRRGQILLRTFSEKYGAVNGASLSQNGDAFLRSLCQQLYTPPSQYYSTPSLTKKMEPGELKKQHTYPRENGKTQTYSYFPANAQEITGFVMAYKSETEEDEIELEYISIAPTYKLETQINSWYWMSAETAEKQFKENEWICLQVVQSYALRKKINPYFESYTE